jgi:hypothetical protein
MSNELLVAIIGAVGAVSAALITAYFSNKTRDHSSKMPQLPPAVVPRSSNAATSGFTSQKLVISGRQIKVANGKKTQTINVFDTSNLEGNYEQVYRISDQQNFVTKEFLLQHASSLQDLDQLLVQREAKREGARQVH